MLISLAMMLRFLESDHDDEPDAVCDRLAKDPKPQQAFPSVVRLWLSVIAETMASCCTILAYP